MATFDTTLLQRRGLGKRILALLHSKHPLPQAGIIAGQSVASAVDELFKLTPPVYNDIDVFLSGAQWQDQTGEDVAYYRAGYKSRIMASVNYRAEKFETVEAEYARIFLISDRMLYTVVKARTDGLINRVWVSWSEFQTDALAGPRIAARRAAGRAAALITGFDLNCTQIAVDIQSGNLTYSKAFADYFATRQLAIVRTFTPIQSLLRYLKKRDELACCYGNDEAHVELIRRLVLANELDQKFRDVRIDTFLKGRVKFSKAAALEANLRSRAGVSENLRVGTGVEGAPLAFGKKYAGLLDQYGNELKPYFDTIRHPKKELFLFSSRDNAPPLPPRPSLPTQITAQPRRFWQLYLPPSKLTSLMRAEFERFKGLLSEDLAGRYRHIHNIHGDPYLEGAESPSGLTELATIVNAHPEVGHSIVAMQLGMQIAVVRLARRHLKKAGMPEAWGIFSYRGPHWAAMALENPRILETAIARMKGSDEPAVDALPLLAALGDIEIVELRSPKALREEGNRMRHCVGGYAHAVDSGRSRIVSLRGGSSSKDCSTLEWRVEEDPSLLPEYHATFGDNIPLQLKLQQNYSFGNSIPKPILIETEARLREELNAWLLANPRGGYELLRSGRWQEASDAKA